MSLFRTAILALVFAAGTAAANDLADFNAVVEMASAHRREALRHLDDGKNELALQQIEHMRESWGAVVSRFGAKPPNAFNDRELYTTTMVTVSTRLVAASLMLNTGRPEIARDSLLAIGADIEHLRMSSGGR